MTEPVGKLEVVRMIFVGETESGQVPGIFQVGVEREAVGFNGQRGAVGEYLHSAGEIVGERIFEAFAPGGRAGRQTAQSERDGSDIEASVESAAAVETDLVLI